VTGYFDPMETGGVLGKAQCRCMFERQRSLRTRTGMWCVWEGSSAWGLPRNRIGNGSV